MEKKEFLEFLRGMLKKIVDVELFMGQSPPKHILAYRKMLGIQQKMDYLDEETKSSIFFTEIIKIRGSIFYFINGRYDDGINSLTFVKNKIVQLIKHYERDKN